MSATTFSLAHLGAISTDLRPTPDAGAVGVLQVMILAYLVAAALTATILSVTYVKQGGLRAVNSFFNDRFLLLLGVISLLWPGWLAIYLMVRIPKSQQPSSSASAASQPAMTETKPEPRRRRRTHETRCDECSRTLKPGELGYVWRGGTVCRSCREALVVLDA